MLGTDDVYDDADAQLPDWAILGGYGNCRAKGKRRSEYIWLPTEDVNSTFQLGASLTDKLGATLGSCAALKQIACKR